MEPERLQGTFYGSQGNTVAANAPNAHCIRLVMLERRKELLGIVVFSGERRLDWSASVETVSWEVEPGAQQVSRLRGMDKLKRVLSGQDAEEPGPLAEVSLSLAGG